MSGIDWTIMWKFFHYQFFGIDLIVGIPIRLVFATRLKPASMRKTSLYVFVSSLVAALLSTWFPLLPILAGAILVNAAGDAAGQSTLITVPIVAASMAIETALADAVLFRLLLKCPARKRLAALMVANILNSTLAIALGLAWAYRHMPVSIDM